MRGWGVAFGFVFVCFVVIGLAGSRVVLAETASPERASSPSAGNKATRGTAPNAAGAASNSTTKRDARAIDRVIVSEPLPDIPETVRLDIANAPAAFAWTPVVKHANGQVEPSAMVGANGGPSLTLYVWLMMTGLIAFAGWYGWTQQAEIAARLRAGVAKAPWATNVTRVADSIGARFRHASSSFTPASGDTASYATDVLEKRLQKVANAVADVPRSVPLREVLDDELRRVRQRLAAASGVTERSTPNDAGEASPARGRLSAPAYRVLLRDLERIERIAVSAQRSITAGDGGQSLIMPTSAREAYEVLGINGNVTDATLKKIVDALRMSWHPDLASGAEDRSLREERIKQINVATELIAAERRAA